MTNMLAMTVPGALAYIDPGTQTQIVWMLSAVLGAAGFFFGILLWPFRKLLGVIRRRVGARAAWIVFWAALLAVLGGGAGTWYVLSREGKPEAPKVEAANYDRYERVIVLGMDGLDPGVMEGMMDKGELPNFDKLRKTGSFSRLQTTLPPETPVAWSSIATGTNPGKHAIFEFLHRDPGNYKPILAIYKVNTRNLTDKRENRYLPVRLAPGFWTYASQAGVPTTVIRWPAAFPPEEVTGRFFSGLGVPDVNGRLGQYSLFTTEEKAPAGFKGHWCSAAWEGEQFKSKLAGPVVAGLTGRKEATLDVVVTRAGPEQVSLKVGEADAVALKVGQWTPYLAVDFKPGWGKKVPAMVRGYLAELTPKLRLYVSTPEVDPEDPYFPITSPDGYAKELADAIGRYQTLGMPEDVNAMSDGTLSPEAFLQSTNNLQAERQKQFDRELAGFWTRKGLFAFIFDASDRIQHMFWRAGDPEHPNYDPEFARKFGQVIPDHYRLMDAILGQVLAKADARTAVLVCSDHGFNTFRTKVGLNSWLVEKGYMVLNTADGRNGRELFADVDWSRTKAYAVGFTDIYINLKGREKQGVIEPGEPYRKLCDELKDKLGQLADPATGKRAIRNVYLAVEEYHGQHVADGPDLIVGFNAGFRAESSNVIGGSPAQVMADNMDLWSGDHLMDPHVVPAFFASNRPLRRSSPRCIDVAPTVLQCFGIKRPEAMDGEPLF